MKFLNLKPICFLVCGMIFTFAAPNNLFGQEKVYADQNFAFTVPESWSEITNLPPQAGLLGRFGDANKARMLIVGFLDSHKPSAVMDDQAIAAYEQSIETGRGSKRIWGKVIQLAGVKAYQRLGAMVLNGTPGFGLTQVVYADGKIYQMEVLSRDSDIDQDPEVQKCLASFRFITPPPPPPAPSTLPGPASAAPSTPPPPVAATEGVSFINLMAYVVFAIIGIVLVGVVVHQINMRNKANPPGEG